MSGIWNFFLKKTKGSGLKTRKKRFAHRQGERINKRSDYLVILVATYNRLELLKKTIDSIKNGTSCSHEIVVIDGGSSDETIEYLKSNQDVTPVFQGKLIGQVRALNEVWKNIESRYTCWINDDIFFRSSIFKWLINLWKPILKLIAVYFFGRASSMMIISRFFNSSKTS